MPKQASLSLSDSTPWKLAAKTGDIVIPDRSEFRRLPIVEKSTSRRRFGQHYDTIGPEVVEFIAVVCGKIGITPRELRLTTRARMLFNAHVFREIAAKYKMETVTQTTLFGPLI